jgi:uncharacterized membrane protein SpoIIM required for sporulation
VDVDRFLADNGRTWDRLDELTRRAGRNVKRLSPAELDELVTLYQRVSTHLSVARTAFREPALVARLTGLVARAGAVIYGTRPRTWRAVGRFFADTFPAALWHIRRFIAVSAAIFVVSTAAIAIWIAHSHAALEATGPAAVRQAYVTHRFEDYYSSQPAAQFASHVFTNNVQVAIMAFAAGILFCVLTAYILATNGANLGVAAGLFAVAGQQSKFWGLILPHGLLELTAVCIAGGAGLRLGWTLIDPGDRRRAQALVEEGRRAIVVVLGLIVVFAAAGTIEGFVTGSELSTWVRVGIGAAGEAVFLVYAIVLGRRAAAAGHTGVIGEAEQGRGWTAEPEPITSVPSL